MLAHGLWFSPASFTTKTGHDIAEILLKVGLSTINKLINQSIMCCIVSLVNRANFVATYYGTIYLFMCWYFIIDVICVHPENKNALNIITTVDWHLSIWYVFFVLKFWYILFFKSVLDRFDTLCIYPACKRLNACRTIDKINNLTLLVQNIYTSYNLYNTIIQVITCTIVIENTS